MSKKEIIWVSIFVATLLSIVFGLKHLKNREIDNNLGITKGTIIKAYKNKLANRFIYTYSVERKIYTSKESLEESKYVKGCCRDNSCLGKQFIVEYSTKNPQHSRILLDKPLEDTVSIIK